MLEAKHHINETGAGSLVERVRKLPNVRQMARAIEEGTRRLDVTGLRGSSPVLLVEALRLLTARQIIVCCSDGERAQDALSDLGTFSTARATLFPEKDIFPQRSAIRENLTVRGQRNASLSRVLRGDVDIIVTTLLGLLEKTVTTAVLTEHSSLIKKDQKLDLEELRGYLVSVGYDAVQVVEEIAQFAVRGSIVDVFDPSWDQPARIELVDDEVVSIRMFDIDTQRSQKHCEQIPVLPASGVFVDEQTLAGLEQTLRDKGVAADKIKEIQNEIEHHRYSYLLRRYAPAMGVTGSLLDFFAKPPVIVFLDQTALAVSLETFGEEIDYIAKTDDEFPLLDTEDYLHAPDYYTAHGTPAVHLWAAGVKTDNKGGVSPETAIHFETKPHPPVHGKLDPLIGTIRALRKKNVDVHVFSESQTQRERLADMLGDDEALVHLPIGWITAGFIWETAGMAMLTDHEIFHRMLPRPLGKKRTRRMQTYTHDHLQLGDFVVHVDYGIGRYVGLEKLDTAGGETECLTLRYHGNDRIYVPLEQMPLVEKYIGKEGVEPSIDRLGSVKWQRTKAKTKKALEETAKEMLNIYAQREITNGFAFGGDTQWQKELEASFPFEETPDQLRSTHELKQDMENEKPMDRLICGDVGFGKTEVAIRAAFKSANAGKQVGVLVPTTVLALQHYKTFQERMGAFPVRVAMLSRFKSPAEQKKIIAGLGDGSVDIVIGTHRLLSKDIKFHDLGLLIIDEEHRFGVRSKEKLKDIKKSVDVLSMTATPIPRTLYMAISGLRPISMIDTPPRNRHPVQTEVLLFDEDTIARAIRAEIRRGGQAFFVHNRVASIMSIQAFLERLLPEVSFGVAHGQMGEKQLEKQIVNFLDKKYDVLITTTIIESGLDFPDVNTIIINRADRFGLAELYQLRGRVGRRERQAFAYLLVPRNFSITKNAGKRLQAMEEFEELGSGYRLAMRDLEIRGAGNVLGIEQHGRLVAVGFDLYCKMLKEAVERMQGRTREELPPCKMETGIPSFLPETYVEDQNERMSVYRRLARLEDPEPIDAIEAELCDRFGSLPVEAVNLIELTRLKLFAMHIGAGLIQFKQRRVIVEFLPGRSLEPTLCADVVETFQGRVLFKSGDTFGVTVMLEDGARPVPVAKKLLKRAYDYVKNNHSTDEPLPEESA